MPFHKYICECGNGIKKLIIKNPPEEIECKCGSMMKKSYKSRGRFIITGDNCSTARKKREENLKIGRQAAKARELKQSGKVPMDATIKIDDKKVRD